LAAAKYIASQLKLLKIEPAGDNGDYLQSVKFSEDNSIAAAPDRLTTIRGTDSMARQRSTLSFAETSRIAVIAVVSGRLDL